VPAAAVVDDAVSLSRAVRRAAASGFVNAVLRRALRQRQRLPLPPRPDDTGDRSAARAYLGVTHSHPDWLVARWLDRHGFENTERWVRFNNEPARLTLRVNRLRSTREALQTRLAAEGVVTETTPVAPHGLIVTAGNPLSVVPDGSFVVQDEASQLVARVVDAGRGETILDVCASPGGKTTDMAADMADTGVLVACDVRERRLRLLTRAVVASGAAIVRLVHTDTQGPLPFAGAPFHRVLVDAPCSGLGTLRRDPDIRWRRSEHELAGFAARQLDLLTRAAAVVAPGGRLVYATCSSEPEENEAVVDAFLASHGEFSLLDLRGTSRAFLSPVLDTRGRLHTLPFAHGLEAFFAAALLRRAGAGT
jgi:16S rRNA (cytosine967-C5)-methyltransferase